MPSRLKRSRSALQDQDPEEQKWLRAYGHLIKFKRHFGCWPRPTEKYPGRFYLGQWMYQNRREFFEGRLSKFRLKKLKEAGCPLDPIRYVDQYWDQQIRMLKRFRRIHPDRWPYASEEFPQGNRLGRWLRDQKIKHTRGTLKKVFRNRLRAIGYPLKAVLAHDALWRRRYQVLVAYRKRNPKSWPTQSERLGQWCNTQRLARKVRRLTRARVKLLNQLGFIWSVKRDRWDAHFQQLVRYLNKHGKAPTTWSSQGGAHEKLAVWLAFQKARYRRGVLELDRLRKLKQLGIAMPKLSRRR